MPETEGLGSVPNHLGLTGETRAQIASGSQELRDKLLRVPDVAYKLAVKTGWVYDHAAELGGFKVFGLLRFRESELDRFIAEQALAVQK